MFTWTETKKKKKKNTHKKSKRNINYSRVWRETET